LKTPCPWRNTCCEGGKGPGDFSPQRAQSTQRDQRSVIRRLTQIATDYLKNAGELVSSSCSSCLRGEYCHPRPRGMGLFLTLTFEGDGVSGVAGPPEGGRRGLTTKTRRHGEDQPHAKPRSREEERKSFYHREHREHRDRAGENKITRRRGDAERGKNREAARSCHLK
jgi:hypothetical protein